MASAALHDRTKLQNRPSAALTSRGRFCSEGWWRRGESNPRPRISAHPSVYVRIPPAKISFLRRPWARCSETSLRNVSPLCPEAQLCDQPTSWRSCRAVGTPCSNGQIKLPVRSCCRQVNCLSMDDSRGDLGSSARNSATHENRSKPVRPHSKCCWRRLAPETPAAGRV